MSEESRGTSLCSMGEYGAAQAMTSMYRPSPIRTVAHLSHVKCMSDCRWISDATRPDDGVYHGGLSPSESHMVHIHPLKLVCA